MRMGETTIFRSTSQAALDGAGDKLRVVCSHPMRVIRFGFVVTVLLDNTPGTLNLDLDYWPHGGSRALHKSGEWTADMNPGDVGYVSLDGPSEKLDVKAGDILDVEVSGAATAGDGWVWLEAQELPFGGPDGEDQSHVIAGT